MNLCRSHQSRHQQAAWANISAASQQLPKREYLHCSCLHLCICTCLERDSFLYTYVFPVCILYLCMSICIYVCVYVCVNMRVACVYNCILYIHRHV